ncbi:hypothetical protein BGZ57DRAFT_936908 [Hyaloscypha finlandica]|nr:hypothetical protein BGZ57DRAFT_936908 [Hyaloscypha finlandica]
MAGLLDPASTRLWKETAKRRSPGPPRGAGSTDVWILSKVVRLFLNLCEAKRGWEERLPKRGMSIFEVSKARLGPPRGGGHFVASMRGPYTISYTSHGNEHLGPPSGGGHLVACLILACLAIHLTGMNAFLLHVD